ncbi:MAG TPA: helix-turn-helix domain-containing protein [Ruminiclostridium sp.]
MRKQHDKQFKDAVKYYIDHNELALTGCSKNLGKGGSTLFKWLRESNE